MFRCDQGEVKKFFHRDTIAIVEDFFEFLSCNRIYIGETHYCFSPRSLGSLKNFAKCYDRCKPD